MTLPRPLGALASRLIYFYRSRILRDPVEAEIARWFAVRGDETLRLDYPLGPGEVVFDVGGYRGDWTERIVRRYGAMVFVFEPIPGFADAIAARFVDDSRIRVFPFGLGAEDKNIPMRIAEDASGRFARRGAQVGVRIRDIAAVITENGIDEIGLIKINIEGGEYEVLDRLLATGLVQRCRDIQVQFHRVVPNAAERRSRIRMLLRGTHELTYDFTFVWENWRRRPQ